MYHVQAICTGKGNPLEVEKSLFSKDYVIQTYSLSFFKWKVLLPNNVSDTSPYNIISQLMC